MLLPMTQEGQQQLMVSRMSQETATHRKVREMHRALDDVRTSTAVLQADLGIHNNAQYSIYILLTLINPITAELLQMDTSKDRTTHKLQREAKTLLKQVMQSLDTTQHVILTIVLHSFKQSMQTHRKMSHHQTTKQREQNSQLGHTQYKEIPAYTQYSKYNNPCSV